jgi:multiple sugar transport system substrate-binding protein
VTACGPGDKTHVVIAGCRVWSLGTAVAVLLTIGCGGSQPPLLTFSGSAVGREADLLRGQLARFEAMHPPLQVQLRATPDAADDRHQLYVQWLNAHASDPDVLQLDVIWTPEFAAAGWILGLDRFHPPADQFFSAAIRANRWNNTLYAVPWFMDVGMLYWRTDLMRAPPGNFDELMSSAVQLRTANKVPFGFVWQGARYEGLITVFLEHLGGFGGQILDDNGAVVVNSEAGVRALTYMRDAIDTSGAVPRAVLTWQEEQVRFAFQNGQAAFMRNWPYAYALLDDASQSRVAGRFDVAPMPSAPDGSPTAALGGSQLAINAYSDHADAAYALIEYLVQPEQMLERARVAGQLPARPALYDDDALESALGLDAATVRRIIERAVPRPVTPVYNQISEILQVHLHRALTRQQDPRMALHEAAGAIGRVLDSTGLSGRQ